LGVEELTLYPAITANLYALIRPIPDLTINPSVQYTGSRYIDVKGAESLSPYFLANLKFSYKINDHISLSSSVGNIFDTYYEIKQHSPMPGRSYSFILTLSY
jgi:iron complex outermembrane receptor protein